MLFVICGTCRIFGQSSGAFNFVHIIVMEKLLFAVIPGDQHTGPVGSLDRAPIGHAVMPRDTLADFQFFQIDQGS